MTAQQQDWLDADGPGFEPVHVPGDGPHDVEDLDPEVTLAAGTVDFGAVRVPVPDRGTVAVDPSEKGRLQAIHVSVPEGRLSVSALAAPKSSRLWPDLVKEIDASLREGGARVRSFQGDWGRELHATSGAATSLFVGVDGARWMLYGVATGPTRDADALDEQLRRMMRGTIVVRGRSPYPVRTVLPLEVPEHLATSVTPAVTPAVTPEPEASGSVVELRSSTDAGYRSAPTAAYPAEAAPAPPTTALPVTGAPATTALPLVNGVGSVAATTALPVSPPRARGPVNGVPPWSDPVHRIADPGSPFPLDAGPDPDDRPTDIRPAFVETPPTERWPAPEMPGAAETAPWALDAPVPPGSGGRRRLREPGGHLPVSPGLTGPWAPWPESPTGSGRALDPAHRSERRPAATFGSGPTDRPPAAGRRAGDPPAAAPGPARTGRRRAVDPAPEVVPPGHVGGFAPETRVGRRRHTDTGPGGARPDGRPVDARPGDARPADAGPRAARSADSGSTAARSTGAGPAADAPVDDRSVEVRPTVGRLGDVPAPPPPGRRRLPDPAPAEAPVAVPDVLRVGRHAVVEPQPDRPGRGAETQPWVAPRASRPGTAPGPVTETAPWAVGSRQDVSQQDVSPPAAPPPGSGLVTEPLAVPPPQNERPRGRHHRPD